VLRGSFLAFCKSFEDQTSNDWIENFRKAFGLGEEQPAYSVELIRGSLLATGYPLRLTAGEGAVEVRLSQAALPCRLPIEVSGLNPNMPAAIYEKSRDQMRMLPVFEGATYVTVDLRESPADLFIGNLVTCDRPEVSASLVPTQRGYHLEVHNPTEHTVTSNIRGAAGFAPLAGWKALVTLKPGTSRMFHVAAATGQAHLQPEAW